MQAKDKKQQLTKNALIIAFGSLSVQIVSFLLLPFYTAHLSPRDFGTVDLISTYTILLAPIVSLQLSMAAFRFLVDAREDAIAKKRVITNTLQAAAVSLGVFAALAALYVSQVHVAYAPLAIANICAAAAMALGMQFARGLGRNKVFAVAGVIAGFTAILFNILLIAGLHMGAAGMLAASIIGSASGIAYLTAALRLHRHIDPRSSDKQLRRQLLSYSLPLIPNGISWWVIDAFDRTIISAILGLGANGVYAVAYKFPIAFASFFSFFGMSWTESSSMHIDSDDRDKFFSEVFNASMRFFACLAACMVAGIGLLFSLLIDAKYNEAHRYIPILLAASFFNAVVGLYSAIYIAKKMTKKVANTSIFAAIINVVLTLASIKLMGMYGTALATVIAYLAMAVYRHYDTKKYLTLTYERGLFVKLLLLYAGAMALYYYNTVALNTVNVAAVGVVSLVLNRGMVQVVKDKVLKKVKRLTPDQEVAEEAL